MEDVLIELPKAELHVHIEGTLEPGLMFEMARRNGVDLPYADEESVRRAYVFEDLQSFLDIYYAACNVLVHDRDFYELTLEYLRRAATQGVRHAEIFFDPQTHLLMGSGYAPFVRPPAGDLGTTYDEGIVDSTDAVPTGDQWLFPQAAPPPTP